MACPIDASIDIPKTGKVKISAQFSYVTVEASLTFAADGSVSGTITSYQPTLYPQALETDEGVVLHISGASPEPRRCRAQTRSLRFARFTMRRLPRRPVSRQLEVQ